MSSFVYDKGSLEMGDGGDIDYLNDSIKVALFTASYNPAMQTDESLADLTGEISGVGYTSGGKLLTGKSMAGSEPTVCYADNLVWSLLSAMNVRYAVMYKDSGAPATSWLIACVDFGENMDLIGQDLSITWSNEGAFYINQLESGTFIQSVSEMIDDGCSVVGEYIHDDTVQIGRYGGAIRNAYFLFREVNITPGMTIQSAVLELTSFGSYATSPVNCHISCNDIDDAVAPQSLAEHTAMERTAANVPWETLSSWVDGTVYASPDFADAVQEVINRPGFCYGNALMVFLDEYGSGSNAYRRAMDVDENISKAGKIIVEWSGPLSGMEEPTIGLYDTRIRLRARKRGVLLTTKVRNLQ